jgi:hypothetical protein
LILVKKLDTKKLCQLSGPQQEYYIFLAKECFAGFSNAEDNFDIYRYASCNAWLFHCSEFFWKALTVLSGKYFNRTHEASQADIKKISSEILSDDDKVRVYDVLSKFPNIRRDLARYGYYGKEGVSKSFSSVFNKDDTETSLDEVSFLIDKLREIHYYQIFEPPIKIGILSGYISARNEKPCSYYPHSGYRKAVQWMLDLKNIKHDGNALNLFNASMTPISCISNSAFSVILNPFGEAYPESGNAEGAGFKTIASYIRDGGIFVNSGGQSFTYSWDVNTGNSRLLVSFIPSIRDIQTSYVDGIPVLQIKESFRVPSESLLLKRYFGLETEWDNPANNIVGPKETAIEFDKILGQDTPRTKAKVYRPVRKLSQNVIPLVHSSDSLWNNNNNIYPVVAVKFGRGFLIHTGMSLDEEREYNLLLDIITRLCLTGYETLAGS